MSTRHVELSSGFRILLSILGGVFAIGMIESAAAIYTLLRFGLAGTQTAGAVYAAAALAGAMFLAASSAAFAVLGSSIGRDAWSMRRGLYLPMLLLAVTIYCALLLTGLLVDSTKLYGELLDEKRFSVVVYVALAAAAVVVVRPWYR